MFKADGLSPAMEIL